MSNWVSIFDAPPPVDEIVWAYDSCYGGWHLATWNGKDRADDGYPSLDSITETGDDYWLLLWQPCEIPDNPDRDEIKAVHKSMERAADRKEAVRNKK